LGIISQNPNDKFIIEITLFNILHSLNVL